MVWNLYEKEKFLKPLSFSNGKTQEDVVKEVLNSIEEGNKVIFIEGVCGTGKSAIALNIARNIGKASVVVPIKNLQSQYKKDYEGDKYLLKENGKKLNISVITGRKNHQCKFLSDNGSGIPQIRREVNSKLHDIFSKKKQEIDELVGKDESADNHNIPCKIDIREKNMNRIKHYLKQNSEVDETKFSEIKDVKRVSVAGVCPYWCPVLPSEYELGGKSFSGAEKKKYWGVSGKEYLYYKRKEGCPFYKQFESYIDSDVIVFNSLKYKLETILGRKPSTEIEIVDECDEFLDKFSNEKNLNIDRILNSMNGLFQISEDSAETLFEIREILNHIKRDSRVGKLIQSGEIVPLKNTGLFDLFRIFLKNPGFLYEIDEENYLNEIEESARMFEGFFEDTYVQFSKKDESIIASVVTTNLEKNFKKMVNQNKIVVLMSGTLHSEGVLKEVFGLSEFKKIQAEIQQQGQINVVKTGLEMDCKYSNFSSGKCSREGYLKALDKCLEVAKKPVVVHINAFSDLPDNFEKKGFGLNNLISKEELIDLQNLDKEGRIVDEFKEGKTNVLFSTKVSRGVDFPGDQCKSIIFTKYPNPNVQNAFWKILNKTQPQKYWSFYRDKARRELLQKIYRGLRFKEDKVDLLSPDSRVIGFFENQI